MENLYNFILKLHMEGHLSEKGFDRLMRYLGQKAICSCGKESTFNRYDSLNYECKDCENQKYKPYIENGI